MCGCNVRKNSAGPLSGRLTPFMAAIVAAVRRRSANNSSRISGGRAEINSGLISPSISPIAASVVPWPAPNDKPDAVLGSVDCGLRLAVGLAAA